MPNISRYFVEAPGNTILADHYNGEFDNIIDNGLTADGITSASATIPAMQAVTDPGEQGTESQATSERGELQRLRNIIREITGKTYWYETPAINLQTISTLPQGLHIGLEFEGALMGASSTTDVLAKVINQGAIINAASLSTADVAAADFDGTNKKFGSYSYSLGSGNVLAFPGQNGNVVKGSLSAWFRNMASGDYVAYNPLLGIELYMDSNSRLAAKLTKRTAASESAKATAAITQTTGTDTGDSTFRNVILKWRTNSEGGAGTDLLGLLKSGSTIGTQLSAQTISINPGDGGYWFVGSKRNDPAWTHFYAASGLPTAHSFVWASNGTPNGSISDGVLNISTSGATGFYSKTGAANLTQVNLANETIEIKARLNSTGQRTTGDPAFCSFSMLDDSMNRSLRLNLFPSSVTLSFGVNVTFKLACEITLDTSKYHVYRITSSGTPSPTTNLYIDGLLVFTGTNTISDTTANDKIQFGTSASSTTNSDWEWVAFDTTVSAPVAASTSGNLDSWGVTSDVISNDIIAALQTSKIGDIFGGLPSYGPTLPLQLQFDRIGATTPTTTASTFADFGSDVAYLPGDGTSEYTIRWAGNLSHSSAGSRINVTIDVDNDVTGTDSGYQWTDGSFQQEAVNDAAIFSIQRTVLLPPGLHEVRPNWLTDAATASVDGNNSLLSCSLRKVGRLA